MTGVQLGARFENIQICLGQPLGEHFQQKAPRELSPAAKFRGGNSAYLPHEFVRQQHHFQQIAITLIIWFGNVSCI